MTLDDRLRHGDRAGGLADGCEQRVLGDGALERDERGGVFRRERVLGYSRDLGGKQPALHFFPRKISNAARKSAGGRAALVACCEQLQIFWSSPRGQNVDVETLFASVKIVELASQPVGGGDRAPQRHVVNRRRVVERMTPAGFLNC